MSQTKVGAWAAYLNDYARRLRHVAMHFPDAERGHLPCGTECVVVTSDAAAQRVDSYELCVDKTEPGRVYVCPFFELGGPDEHETIRVYARSSKQWDWDTQYDVRGKLAAEDRKAFAQAAARSK